MKAVLASIALIAAVPPAMAQDLFVSANDDNQRLDDGAQIVPPSPRAGSVSLIAVDHGKPRIVATVAAPTSIIGPPHSIAISPDGRTAIVTAARRIDPADPSRIIPDDRVTVIALGDTPHVVQTLRAGAGAAGVAIDRAGRQVLVANRSEGTVSLFALDGGRLRFIETVSVGAPGSAPAQPIFFDAGRRALVTRDGDSRIAMLSLADGHVTLARETLAAGLRPYAIDSAGGRFAVTGNIGGGGIDMDTISLIDLAPSRPRVVDTVSVGLTPEGVAMSGDGRFVAVNVNNGSNMPRASQGYSPQGLVQIWAIDGTRLRLVASAPVAPWGQGLGWTRDGRTLLVQSAVGDGIASFRFDGKRLATGPTLRMPAGPAALAGPP